MLAPYLLQLVWLGWLPLITHAYLTDPPTNASPDTVTDCSNWVVATSGANCQDLAASNGLSLDDFELVYVSGRLL